MVNFSPLIMILSLWVENGSAVMCSTGIPYGILEGFIIFLSIQMSNAL